MTKTKHYDLLKIITMMLVVLAHSSVMYGGSGVITPANSSGFLYQLTWIIYAFHMPLFMAISGMVYGLCIYDRGKYPDALRFVGNKALRILVPYLVFGILYVAPVMCLLGFTDESYAEYCIKGILLTDNPRHLWFLVVLFEIFLVCAISKRWILKTNCAPVILLLLLICYYSDLAPGKFHLSNMLYYLLYFYLGYTLNRYYEKITELLKKPWMIILLIAAFVGCYLLNTHRVCKILAAIAGGSLAVSLTALVPREICERKLFKILAADGFGIYLFHPMIIYVLYYFLGEKDVPPVLMCLGIAAFTYVLSLALTELVRKLRMGVIIGEKAAHG